jgi:hypothetical protein
MTADPEPKAPNGSIGHNNPPQEGLNAGIAQQIEAIVDSGYTATQKLVLVKMRLRADHRTLDGAYPSYATLMRAASVKDQRAVAAALDHLVDKVGIVTRKERSGRSPLYGLSRDHVQALIAEAMMRNREMRGPGRPKKPPTSDVGGLSQKPHASDAVGFQKPPTLDEWGFQKTPPHLMQKPPTSNVPRSNTYLRKVEGGAETNGANGHHLDASPSGGNGHGLHTAAPTAPDEAELAVASYNDAAQLHGYIPCGKLTPPLRKRLERRLAEIGGLAEFSRAVSAIPLDAFLSGRVTPHDGRPPFKLNLERLLRTEGGMGDVLVMLLGLADENIRRHGGEADAQAQRTDLRNNLEASRTVLRGFRPDDAWRPSRGPPPGSPDCLFHPTALRECGFLKGDDA